MPNKIMPKIYLFDFDDTIISTKIYAQIYTPLLVMIKRRFKWSNKQLEMKARELGVKKNKFGRYDTGDLCRELGLLKEYYVVLEKKIKVVPVLHDAIAKAFVRIKDKKKKIGIVSNSMRRTITLYLKKYKMLAMIDFIFCVDDAKCTKKEARYWKKLIIKEKLNPSECLMIGDDPVEDGKIPRSLGFKTVVVRHPRKMLKIF